MENASTVTHSYPTISSRESVASAVSWAAVIAGAVIAAALSLMLLAGGAGLGFVSMSPWSQDGASATTLGIAAIIWLLLTQIIAYGVAGYITGRLRTRWVDIHSDEAYFRDTAHGLLVWALSAIISALVMGSAISSISSGAAKLGASAASGAGAAVATAATSATQSSGMSADYFIDTLFRKDQPSPDADSGAARAEIGRIITASLSKGEISAEDKAYVAKVIAAETGIDQNTAETRVDQAISRSKEALAQAEQTVREAADQARKAAAAFSLWTFASLLIGAFVASWMAAVGGRRREA